jgi:hypothetical protein
MSIGDNRQNVITLLRDKSLWPDTFWWHYGDCHQCAIGLVCAAAIIDSPPEDLNSKIGHSEPSLLSEYLGITPQQAYDIFWRCGSNGEWWPNPATTPEMVADALAALP